MKLKKIVLLLLCVFVLSGCSIVRINTDSYETNIEKLIKLILTQLDINIIYLMV